MYTTFLEPVTRMLKRNIHKFTQSIVYSTKSFMLRTMASF